MIVISFQVIRMNIERFSVPELLFHPSDIGLEELGIPEAILHSVSSLPEGWCLFLCGGITLCLSDFIITIHLICCPSLSLFGVELYL